MILSSYPIDITTYLYFKGNIVGVYIKDNTNIQLLFNLFITFPIYLFLLKGKGFASLNSS